MRSREARGLLCALAGTAAVLLAPTCTGGSGSAPPVATVSVQFNNAFRLSQGYLLKTHVLVVSNQPFQAFDLELQWNPGVAQVLVDVVQPHPDFDDDGRLFAGVVADAPAGRLRNLVDLRHGGPGASGQVRVATAWFYAPAGGEAVISASGTIAGGNGGPFSVVAGPALVYSGP